ncbi:MAG: DUF4919 domain-containing protein [Ferruginibacter sp.]
MQRKIILAAVLLLSCLIGLAQFEKPDFDKIEKEIRDKNSPYYYPELLKRYTANDTTLSVTEYRYLYYGYSFQEKYSPYGSPAVADALSKAIAANETDKAIELEKAALAEYPFNIRNLYMLRKLLDKKGDTSQADIYDKKMISVAKAILSTGDGLSDSTAMYVISVSHEYDIIFLLGYKSSGQALFSGKYGSMDRMSLQKNDDDVQYLYFNVDRLFASMERLFDKKKN